MEQINQYKEKDGCISMSELLAKVNEEVKKVADYLKENEDMFDMMDLKLHKASFYDYERDFPLCYKDDEESTNGYNNFYYFCEDNYNMFVEDLKENFNIDFEKMRKQVGRTSKFYLADWIETTHCRLDIENTINALLYDKYAYSLNYTEINEDCKIVPYGEYTEEDEELENIIGFYDWFIEEIKDIKTVYDIIKNFKDNQVEYFKEYLENEEERLQCDIDEEIAEEKEKEEIVNQIKDKYSISDEDIETLKKNI